MNATRAAAWNLELQRVHHRLEAALRAARTAPAGSGRADLLMHCYGFCAALTSHHTSEDKMLFPRLLIEQPELEPVIRRLVSDHQMLARLIERFEATLRELPRVHTNHSVQVDSILDQLHAQMTAHFANEERLLDEALDTLAEPAARATLFLGEQ